MRHPEERTAPTQAGCADHAGLTDSTAKRSLDVRPHWCGPDKDATSIVSDGSTELMPNPVLVPFRRQAGVGASAGISFSARSSSHTAGATVAEMSLAFSSTLSRRFAPGITAATTG